jgi:ATP-binding cassette subfamily F protein uup
MDATDGKDYQKLGGLQQQIDDANAQLDEMFDRFAALDEYVN